MKTIEEAAQEYFSKIEGFHNKAGVDKSWIDAFKAGVEFSEQFYPIERDKDGLVKTSTQDKMESNAPFITRLTNGEEFQYDIWYEFGADIDFNQFYTHWRPIELK